MSITDFRRSSPAMLVGTAFNSYALGGVTVSSNAAATDGSVFVATGSNSGIWRNALAFGSNTNDVGSVGTMGASSSNTRADHVHRGVSSISHTSNTFYGPVILTPGGSIGITSPTPGTLEITSTGGTGGASSVPSKTGAQVYASATQAINSTSAALTFDVEVYDTDGYWTSGAPTRMTIPAGKAGLYLCTANSFHSAAGVSWMQFRVGGISVRGSGGQEPDQSAGYNAISGQFDLVADQYVEVWAGTSASINFGHASALDAQSTFTITRIAA